MLYQFNHSGMHQYFCKEYGEDFNFPMHLHQSYEFITVLSGETSVLVGGKEYTIQKGEGILVFPNQLHSIGGEHCRHMLCIFSGDLVKAFSTTASGKIPANNKFLLPENLIREIDELREDATLLEKKGTLYLVCAQFDKSAEYEENQQDDEGLLGKIFKFIENNYAKDCSLEKICNETGYSYSYISRYFKKATGVSVNTYINQYRISNSCYLLSNTNKSVLECAMECGYETLRSFNRNFMEYTGKTPTEYRKIRVDSHSVVKDFE